MKRFTVFVTPEAHKEIKDLPGNIRQRVRKAIDGLAVEPRPTKSKKLDIAGLATEVRRLRLERWRIVYAVDSTDMMVDVLAIRKRPPYDYGDLATLLKDMPSD
jgi:mRNA interferase RelE/StbE